MRSFGIWTPTRRVAAHRRSWLALLSALTVLSFVVVDVAQGATTVNRTGRLAQLTLDGHGYGAGVGMGQWGDFGYAVRYHRSYQWILNHFYEGTKLATLPTIGQSTDPSISVAITENANATTGVGYDPVVTSVEAFSFTSAVLSPSATTTTLTPTTVVPSTSLTTPATVPATTVPATTVPATTVSATTVSATTVPATTVPATTAPTSTTFPIVIPPLLTTPGPTVTVPAGEAVDFALQPNGTWNAYAGASCPVASAAKATGRPLATGLVDPIVSPEAPSATAIEPLLTLCRHDGVDEPMQGDVQAYNDAGYARTLNLVSLQGYLEGVVPAEESASWGDDGGAVGAPQGQAWGFQSLEAQAVAARSYALASVAAGGWFGFADICDTIACQAYVGAAYQSTISNLAVADTGGEVLVSAGSNKVVLASYSASTGGWSKPGDFPGVRDFGDACVVPGNPLECNPSHDWQVTITGAAITRKYRVVGRLLRVRVVQRIGRGAYGGRAVVVLLKGTKAETVVTGDAFAIALGLRSSWFAIGSIKRA